MSHEPDEKSIEPGPIAGTTRRRDLLRGLALGTASGLLSVPTARGQDDDPGKKPDQKPDEPAPPAKPTEVEARMALVLARYGDQLDGDARALVRSEIEGHVRRAEALRKRPLGNGDGPFPVFHPYRAPLGPDLTDAPSSKK
jgi:hypothetical protein